MSTSILDRISALADPTRSRILLLLDGRELMVGELCAVLQLPQSTVSRHLKILSDERWVVARGEGIPAVCGADAIRIDMGSRSFEANGTKVEEGDVVTIDGFNGAVYVGELALEESKLEKARAGDEAARSERIWQAFDRLMSHADARRRLWVRANADTPDQSTNARDLGAEGIGLCRT